MEKTQSIKLEGIITLKSPLSHIGESLGTDSYLSTDIIRGEDGELHEVFTFSGNAFRGLLRDLGSVYFLEKLGNIQLPLQAFYLLFSGGALSGEQSIDIEQAREFRKFIPHLALCGGGVGNQILPGKMNIGSMYPLCQECKTVLPLKFRSENMQSWRQLTFEKSFTRMDDAKNDNHRGYIAGLPENSPVALPEIVAEQEDMFEAGHKETIETHKKEEKKKEKKEAPQQMRYTVELMAAGTKLYQRIDLNNVTDLELGAFIAALVKFSQKPYIGGKQNIGCGLVDVVYNWNIPGINGIAEQSKFLEVTDEQIWLSKPAEEAKNKYDTFLLDTYIKYIEENKLKLTKLLGVTI